jgi:PAS domain S-box-containing protein
MGGGVSFGAGIPEWQWYVGASFYLHEVEERVMAALRSQRDAVFRGVLWSVVAILGALAGGGFLAYGAADKLRREFREFQEGFRVAGLRSGRMDLKDLKTEELAELGEGVNAMFEHRKASEERFLTMFEACPMGILRYRLNEAGELSFLGGNPSAERILGAPISERIGWKIEALFPGVVGTEIPDAFRKVAKEGGGWESENVAYHHDNLFGHYEVFAFQPIRNEVVVFFVDVSEREESRRALRESDERFRTIMETAYEGIVMAGQDWGITFANRRLGELFGCDPEDIVGNRLDMFMHPGELADHAARMERGENGIAERYERRFIRRDGTVVTMLVSATPVIGEKGVYGGSFAMLVDISEQKRSADVIASLARFPAEDPNPVLRLSRRGVLLYANPGAKRLIEGLGAAVGTPVPEPLRGLVFRASGQTGDRASGQTGDRAFHIDSDGCQYSMIVTAVGNREYVNVYGYDVTDQRRLEDQVRQSQKMEAIGRLAGGVAHDFNNMLQAILGFVDVTRDYLDRGVDPDPALDEIEKAGKRAAELTRQLLAFGRRQMLRSRPVDLNEKVSDLMKMLRRIISEDIELSFSPNPDIGPIMADPVQIDQVLLNLAVNAKDAMPKGGRIGISTDDVALEAGMEARLPTLKRGRYVALSFGDTGSGMTEDVQRHLFEPFFTTKALGRGTGLGLATVYGIVGQHGGAIDVESEPGRGTTFRMYFPVTEHRVADVYRHADTAAPGGDETILLAEDDAGVRLAVKITLESVGYRVIEAEDGQAAVEILRERGGEIELALLDVVMPRMNGIEVQKVIAEKFPRLGVLFSSGYTAQDPQSDYIASSGLELIQKPYDREVLLRAVRRILDGVGDRGQTTLFPPEEAGERDVECSPADSGRSG